MIPADICDGGKLAAPLRYPYLNSTNLMETSAANLTCSENEGTLQQVDAEEIYCVLWANQQKSQQVAQKKNVFIFSWL